MASVIRSRSKYSTTSRNESNLAADALSSNLRPNDDLPSYSGFRWAQVIIRVVASPEDPSTVAAWGRLVGASRGTLATWCRAAKTTPWRSLELARLLRSVVLIGDGGADIQDVMDIVDPRTIRRMLTRAGFSDRDHIAALSPQDFIQQQQLVKNERALGELTVRLRELLRATVNGS